MATIAAVGHGATFGYTGHTAVAQMTRISFPSTTVDDVEVSSMDSTSAAREYLPGMIDYGTIDMDLVFEGSEWTTLHTALLSRTATTWTLTVPDGTATSIMAVSGYLNSLGGEAPLGEALTASATIKCTGVASFTA